MGNHYDPHYEAWAEENARVRELGRSMQASVAEAAPQDVVETYNKVMKLLNGIEENVIGGTAIDRLREARGLIYTLLTKK